MSDRGAELDRAGVSAKHFIFTTESRNEVDRVIDAFRSGKPVSGEVRRIK